MSGRYKVAWLCEALLVSRSGYYDWLHRRQQPGPRQQENSRLRRRIRKEFARSRQTYGSPRLARALGCPGRRNRIARLMRQEHIRARQRSKYRPATTDSTHADPIAPNRLPLVTVSRPDQVWVTDATCVLTAQGWLYVVAVLDTHTRRVVGWAMHEHLDARLVIAALRMALALRRPDAGLILHSDRGSQFACRAYREELAKHGLLASMSRKGTATITPSSNRSGAASNTKPSLARSFATRAEARTAVFDYIETSYNRTRLHSSLGYVSPITFESHLN
jgi:putative transposase